MSRIIRAIRIENISPQLVQFIIRDRETEVLTDLTGDGTVTVDITDLTENDADEVVSGGLSSINYLHAGKAIEIEETLVDLAQLEELRNKRLIILSERIVEVPD